MTQYGVAGQGSSVQCPTQTTTYNLTVIYPNGASETRSITIYVTPAQVGAPVINLFTVTPPQIQPGQCVNVQWDVAGSVTQIVAHAWEHHPLGQRTRAEHDAGLPARHRQRHLHVGGDGSRRAEPGSAVRQHRGAAHGSPTDRRAAHGSAADAVPPTAVPPTAVPPTAVPPTAVPPTAVPVPPIVGKNWSLLTYNNGQQALVSPIAGTQITALFGSDGKVTGTDSCNNYTSPYTVNGSNLQVGAPVLTSMACPEDVMTQAQTYLAALQLSYRYEVSGNQLTIFDSIGTKLLQYAAQ